MLNRIYWNPNHIVMFRCCVSAKKIARSDCIYMYRIRSARVFSGILCKENYSGHPFYSKCFIEWFSTWYLNVLSVTLGSKKQQTIRGRVENLNLYEDFYFGNCREITWRNLTLCMRYSPGAQNMDLMPRLMDLTQPWLAGSNRGRLSTSRCRCIAMSPCISSGNSRITWTRAKILKISIKFIFGLCGLRKRHLAVSAKAAGLQTNKSVFSCPDIFSEMSSDGHRCLYTSVGSMPLLRLHMVWKYSCMRCLSGLGMWCVRKKSLRSRIFCW